MNPDDIKKEILEFFCLNCKYRNDCHGEFKNACIHGGQIEELDVILERYKIAIEEFGI
jgi:hypothetical protein